MAYIISLIGTSKKSHHAMGLGVRNSQSRYLSRFNSVTKYLQEGERERGRERERERERGIELNIYTIWTQKGQHIQSIVSILVRTRC